MISHPRPLLAILALAAALLTLGAPARAQGLGDFLSPGPLAEPHAELDGLKNCTKCHEPGRGVSAAFCMDCHDRVRAQVTQRVGFHADKGQRCQGCHADHRGRDFEMIQFEAEGFAHQNTGFPLLGEHGALECVDCHVDEPTYTGLLKTCLPCHGDDEVHGLAASDRDLLSRCDTCHEVVEGWSALPLAMGVFDHNDPAQADYPLEGGHAEVPCEQCHARWSFTPVASAACEDCHEDPHRSLQRAGEACEGCHETPATWEVPGFDHDLTGYSLTGVHADVPCADCHGASVVQPLPYDDCEDCHEDIHSGQFAPRTCEDCHDVITPAFAIPDFDHDETDYPLIGEHREVPCADCHDEAAAAVYVDLPAEDCVACHDDVHDGRFEPEPCSSCHQEYGWGVDDFDHDLTDFPLRGSHADAECASCHEEEGVYVVEAFASCLACHAEENPHDDSVDATSCESCHDETEWDQVTYDHDAETEFPLEPPHDLACDSCHEAETFAGLETACASCHEEGRPAGHFEGECGDCHAGETWSNAGFGDGGHAITGFELGGMHALIACVDCHDEDRAGGRVGSSCASCHAADDVHQNMLGDRCDDCHSERHWFHTRWRHAQVGWPLKGSHRLAACEDCHAAGYAGTPSECWRCHEGEASRSGAAHQSAYFLSCDSCHKTYDWDIPIYPH